MTEIPRSNYPKLNLLLIKASRLLKSAMYVGLCLFETLEHLDLFVSLLELHQAFWRV